MAAPTVQMSARERAESEDDKELQDELNALVDRICNEDIKSVPAALDMLKFLIRTSTSSMTSVPKPLKYLTPYYSVLKQRYETMKDKNVKKSLADIISVLAMGAIGKDARSEFDCLRFCLLGSMENIGDWGHEYIRHLETEIVQQWVACEKSSKNLSPLIRQIMIFNCSHHDEIQACDLLMEINQMSVLLDYVTEDNYKQICLYLVSCVRYVDESERMKILKLIGQIYLKFREFCPCLMVALQMKDEQLVHTLFATCTDRLVVYQMAFICARHLFPVTLEAAEEEEEDEEVRNILDNSHLSYNFLIFARELDIMEPKTPEEVYKTWLEPSTVRSSVLSEKLDSARQNLASSFVNGFVNCAFGNDKLLTTDEGNKWIYRNKDVGMLSATAALGLIYLWDVDGGLTPIDRYLYTDDSNIKSGALLALGIVNCRIRNDCDPALALLADYIGSSNEELQVGAVLGIGMAYAGTGRADVLDLLLPIVQKSKNVKILGIGSLACGMISLGKNNSRISEVILNRMVESKGLDVLKSPFMLMTALGVALAYFGTKGDIELPTTKFYKMAPSFKLIYFNGKGAAEFIRYLFAYGNIEYEDKRYEQADWKTFKDQTPFGQLPLLEHNGKLVNQSIAIGRYVAKQVGLAGKNDWEDLEIDSVVETHNDLRTKAITAHFEKDEDKKKTLGETLKSETFPFYLSRFESLAKKNNGYLALGRLTWADFYFVTNLAFLGFVIGGDVSEVLAKYPTLVSLKTKVESLPAIKKWIAARPETSF